MRYWYFSGVHTEEVTFRPFLALINTLQYYQLSTVWSVPDITIRDARFDEDGGLLGCEQGSHSGAGFSLNASLFPLGTTPSKI